jgi:aminopeptidase 2
MISRVDTVNLSNMQVESEEVLKNGLHEFFPNLALEPGAWKITKFKATPKMSSYLLAFANGPFVYKEASVKLKNKMIPLRIYSKVTHTIMYQHQHLP